MNHDVSNINTTNGATKPDDPCSPYSWIQKEHSTIEGYQVTLEGNFLHIVNVTLAQ